MMIKIPRTLFDKVYQETESEQLKKQLDQTKLISGLSGKTIEISLSGLKKAVIKSFYNHTKDKDTEYASIIEFYYRANKDPSNIVIHKMSEVLPGLQSYLQSANLGGYLFARAPFKAVLPYLILDIESSYDKDDGKNKRSTYGGRREGPWIIVDMAYSVDGEKRQKTMTLNPHSLSSVFNAYEIEYETEYKSYGTGESKYEVLMDVVSEDGVPIDELLSYFGFVLESKELHDAYSKQKERFLTYVKKYGEQFLVRGIGRGEDSGWYSSEQSMFVDGKPGRAIMNATPSRMFDESDEAGHAHEEDRDSFGFRARKRRYGSGRSSNNESRLPSDPIEIKAMFDSLDESVFDVQTTRKWPKEGDVMVPLHPTLKIYHLKHGSDYTVHVNNLRPYEYKEDISNQLVLPEEIKELTQMFVASSASSSSDIVDGKSQSTILACVGEPGLGKTLLAEVMSEACKKPLYKIQAAELGLDPESLENSLQIILNQAQRWNAVLMIDEANAYIHARGNDIKQNAIVGVFLRLLEYYRGVLILTTNVTRQGEDVSFDIDDAILQRCAAVFRFELPTKSDAFKIWKVQADLLGANLSEKIILKLVEVTQLSGRSIRNLLKNASRFAASREEELSLKHFRMCARHLPLTRSESVKKLIEAKET